MEEAHRPSALAPLAPPRRHPSPPWSTACSSSASTWAARACPASWSPTSALTHPQVAAASSWTRHLRDQARPAGILRALRRVPRRGGGAQLSQSSPTGSCCSATDGSLRFGCFLLETSKIWMLSVSLCMTQIPGWVFLLPTCCWRQSQDLLIAFVVGEKPNHNVVQQTLNYPINLYMNSTEYQPSAHD